VRELRGGGRHGGDSASAREECQECGDEDGACGLHGQIDPGAGAVISVRGRWGVHRSAVLQPRDAGQ
jgi:hypothetical protein